ncbi:MAG: hypothetical protein NTX50_24205 [Candidatus Sumerlaeota bacterium]|nr:hypothetical protein [Candidatus Sumerlaeota bacterium]
MEFDEIVKKIAQFEQAHDVEQYCLYDWKVWPAIRIYLYWIASLPSWDSTYGQGPLAVMKRKAGTLLRIIRAKAASKLHPPSSQEPGLDPCGSRCNAAMVTYSSRIQWLGRAFYHYLADPVVEGLSVRGKSCIVWEFGKPDFPRFQKHAYCTKRLDEEKRVLTHSSPIGSLTEAPAWFDACSRDIRSLFAIDASWRKLGAYIHDTHLNSLVFENWLRACGLPMLITDNWYDPISMGAHLAAHRLGLPRVEIQHGQLFHGNLSYLRWTKAPRGGYETFPAHFWFWGLDDREAMVADNPGVVSRDQIIVGGSLWLNQWRSPKPNPALQKEIEQARLLRQSFSKTILFTVDGQDLSHLDRWLEGAPDDWRCLIRLHRRFRPQINAFEKKLRAFGHPGINVREATSLPLYAVIQASDCHVTSFSTCALEALAFGIPTVILNPIGVTNYREYVDQGFMFPATNNRELIERIQNLAPMTGDQWKAAAQKAFAAPEASERALDWLAGQCNK